jgi:cob(I)alamin adenosyltransferase
MCRARSNKVKKVKDGSDIGRALLHVQKCLFVIQAELAGAQKSIVQSNVDDIEKIIERFENRIPNLGTFVIPGATELSALYDYARSVSRRTERMVINAQPLRIVSPATLAYLNRLSSFLYILARHVACADDVIELSPSY